jgi:hypothetical protein
MTTGLGVQRNRESNGARERFPRSAASCSHNQAIRGVWY